MTDPSNNLPLFTHHTPHMRTCAHTHTYTTHTHMQHMHIQYMCIQNICTLHKVLQHRKPLFTMHSWLQQQQRSKQDAASSTAHSAHCCMLHLSGSVTTPLPLHLCICPTITLLHSEGIYHTTDSSPYDAHNTTVSLKWATFTSWLGSHTHTQYLYAHALSGQGHTIGGSLLRRGMPGLLDSIHHIQPQGCTAPS